MQSGFLARYGALKRLLNQVDLCKAGEAEDEDLAYTRCKMAAQVHLHLLYEVPLPHDHLLDFMLQLVGHDPNLL